MPIICCSYFLCAVRWKPADASFKRGNTNTPPSEAPGLFEGSAKSWKGLKCVPVRYVRIVYKSSFSFLRHTLKVFCKMYPNVLGGGTQKSCKINHSQCLPIKPCVHASKATGVSVNFVSCSKPINELKSYPSGPSSVFSYSLT